MQSAIDEQLLKLRPAASADISSACKALLMHAKVIGMKEQPEAGELHAVWSAHCRDMPATLLATGLAEVLKHWTNTFCLPAPGAVWEEITPALLRMRSDLGAMERALAMIGHDELDPSDRSPTPETDKVIQDTLAMLKTHSNKKGRIF